MTFAFRPAALFALLLAALFSLPLFPRPATAQELVWLQIEAQPTLAEAQERAGAYAAAFENTRGFRLRSGWYAIVLGPYEAVSAPAALAALKRENMVPPDSYVTDGKEFRDPFWPTGGIVPDALPAPQAAPDAAPEPAPEPVATPAPDEETLAEARASESALSAEDKRLLQVALQWFGFYAGGIDGAYGPGTRNAMAAWQQAFGLDPTGILTTHQRATLVANYQAEVAEFGFQPVEERESGINVTLPLALVEFDRYDPPFVHFREKNGSGLSIVLISQPGDQGSFDGLYDILQSLDAMPASGERSHSPREFSIRGLSDTHDSRAWAGFRDGLIKGWMVLSTPEHAERDARLVEVLAQSFRPVGTTALDPGLVPLDEAARRGLVAGLEVKKPKFGRSGFYVSDRGAVLTSAEAVAACGKITLDRQTVAKVAWADEAAGLALLTPERPLSPPAVAAFADSPARIGAQVALAGYSYGERLTAPVLTHGTLEELAGLNGEEGLTRLSLSALAGDAGGPVLDESGAVIGMLLPAATDGARELPQGVAFAASAPALVERLAAAGIKTASAAPAPALPPETLTRHATDMTVLVSCWE